MLYILYFILIVLINVSADTNETMMMMQVKMMKIDLRLANNMRYRKCKQ